MVLLKDIDREPLLAGLREDAFRLVPELVSVCPFIEMR